MLWHTTGPKRPDDRMRGGVDHRDRRRARVGDIDERFRARGHVRQRTGARRSVDIDFAVGQRDFARGGVGQIVPLTVSANLLPAAPVSAAVGKQKAQCDRKHNYQRRPRFPSPPPARTRPELGSDPISNVLNRVRPRSEDQKGNARTFTVLKLRKEVHRIRNAIAGSTCDARRAGRR